MALNWTMISPINRQPVPLPGEKLFSSISGIDLTLRPCSTTSIPSTSASPLTSFGSVHLSNQRVVFIANAQAVEAKNQNETATLESLSIPIGNFQDGRFEQPWLGANYYEASVVPVPEGGLEGLHQVKFSFKEGQAWHFYEVMEEIKSLYNGTVSQASGEDLPAYEPLDNAPPVASGSGSGSLLRPERRHSVLTDEDFDVARIARQAEDDEQDINIRQSIQLERVRHGDVGDESQPPAYS